MAALNVRGKPAIRFRCSGLLWLISDRRLAFGMLIFRQPDKANVALNRALTMRVAVMRRLQKQVDEQHVRNADTALSSVDCGWSMMAC